MKNALLLMGICLIILALGAAFYFDKGTAPISVAHEAQIAAVSNAAAIPITVLAEGTNASQAARVNYRITNQADLESIWAQIAGSSTPPVPDFTKYDVLAIFDGEHTTGGYGVSVVSVSDEGGNRSVTIKHTAPGENCPAVEAITHPYEIVSVPTSAFPLDRVDQTATVPCTP